MGPVGQQPQGQILKADAGGAEATGKGNAGLGTGIVKSGQHRAHVFGAVLLEADHEQVFGVHGNSLALKNNIGRLVSNPVIS
jgi:hypothetical protein